jgi:glycosyltransferase involved in cell wall biosynthesis
MHGQQDNPQVILNKCHLYVHSAIREGFGLAPLEAAACGLPTVCLSAGGISEVVQHNVTGCILPQNTSSSAFASKIIELYRDADLLKSLSENAVRVSKTFDIDTSIDKIIQLYTA